MLRARGFSFIEILIALVLVAVTGAGIYTLTVDIQAKQHNARLAEGAMHVASNQLAHWRLMNTDTPCSASHTVVMKLSRLARCLIDTEDTGYQLAVTEIKNVLTDDGGVYAKTLVLEVRWQDNRNKAQTLRFYFTGSTLRHQGMK
ncbi:type II secretion system protein [Salinivibrio sp. MA427]|uniref:type II secretion system protein n=2 Tax=Salinivibrio TaxID=51366 RepID=UPI0018FEDB8B|nr:type II secretion system protein [Salinivibrio sp. MA427]